MARSNERVPEDAGRAHCEPHINRELLKVRPSASVSSHVDKGNSRRATSGAPRSPPGVEGERFPAGDGDVQASSATFSSA
jgi:hypothetical protein